MLPTSSKLTNGERLSIARRRKGRTQEQEATARRVSLNAYKQAEADAENAPSIRAPAIGKVKPHEACRVLRVRKGLTLAKLSTKLGISEWWLCLIERGQAPIGRLLKFWK